MSVEVKNLSEFHSWVQQWAARLSGSELILLSGEMGSGKTEFVKTLAKHFGGKEVSSPTYTFHQKYDLSNGKILEHWDLYRSQTSQELESVGFWELLNESSGIVCVEWPEKALENAWPLQKKILRLNFSELSQGHRRISGDV